MKFTRLGIALAVAILATGAVIVTELAPNQTRQLSKNQRDLCSYDESGFLRCAGPGTGLCWAKGHNPNFDEPPMSIDVGNPGSPDFGKAELCSDQRQ